ncbi:NPC intracellular cholesterol transporter 2-like [Ischnura elegans]|uniref:NPC intracellular cholesterol transporter 2-like n=1 Tax=Ischnura elegans TaxID=197161 RepID=UPI001ED88CE9|nr:NPC intracellular cholesterol transporter 2-like [Ischnura elegans]
MRNFVVGVLLLLAGSSFAVEFEDCSHAGEVLAVDINNCPKQSCPVTIGSTANISISFTTSVPADSVSGKVYLSINGVFHDVEVRPEACIAIAEPGCPLSTGDIREYKAQISIINDCPPVKASLIWILSSAKEDAIACFATHIHLVTALESKAAIGHPRQRSFRSGSA